MTETETQQRSVMQRLGSLLTLTLGLTLIFAIAAAIIGLPAGAIGALAGWPFHATGTGAKIGAAVGASVAVLRLGYWYWHGRKLQQPGYIPPHPSKLEDVIFVWLCRNLLRAIVGPIQVIGLENAQALAGRALILPSHPHGLDFMAVRVAMPFPYRTIGAASQIGGLNSGLAAFSGTIAIPTVSGKAVGNTNAVIDGSARMLARDEDARELIFPQGLLQYDNVLRPEDFRTGAVRIMQRVDELTDHAPFHALPVALYYWQEPNAPGWLRRSLTRLTVKVGLTDAPKYGVTVVIGKPILLSDLPHDPREATEFLRCKIQELLDQAMRRSRQ
jgi:1-acyl-sn-glycerol-3-phosphate acyltransferase